MTRETLDQRLEDLLNQSDGGDVRISYPDGHSEIKDAKVLLIDDIKKLLTDVLEEVKPERLDRSNDPWEPKSDGPTLDHNIPTLQAWGYNAAIYEMEANQRELGL